VPLQIAVALGPAVYLFNAATGSVEELCSCKNEGDYITSVQWASDSSHLAVGTSDAKVQIWDATRCKQVRELVGHTNRVSSLAWNQSILSSGGRDSIICNWDVRKRKHEACVAELRCHEQEVCGLKWSSGGQLASGGNDNLLCIWNAGFSLQHKITAHQAAVKALAWCPFQTNLLASGGGTADRCIKFWNTHTGAMLNSIDTGSQVCSLQWNRHEREILSSHGYSKNQLCLWKYPSMVKMAELTGHSARVLHMAQSPDGSSVVTAGADETLRFWKVFGEPCSKMEKQLALGASGSHMLRSVSIR
jgi:cell division cycle protein 20 (cofactor of APC complex)